MRFITLLFAFVATTLALPTFDTPASMLTRFSQSDECKHPEPPATCSGAATQDVIVHYGKNTTTRVKDLFLNAAKAAGATVHGVMNDFGFTAFIPVDVVTLMKAHGSTYGLTISENGCARIPWCGEAPC